MNLKDIAKYIFSDGSERMSVVGSGMRKEDREEARKERELMSSSSLSGTSGLIDASARSAKEKALIEESIAAYNHHLRLTSIGSGIGSGLASMYIDDVAVHPEKPKEGPQYDWSKHSGE